MLFDSNTYNFLCLYIYTFRLLISMSAALNTSNASQLGGTDTNSPIYQMQKYFGPLRNSDVDTWAADQFAHETHNLPKAYEGRNKFLMATIDFLITKDDDWYTSAVLPWEYTEELHVAWNVWRFNKTMMDYEPHQGVPRYVTQESESHQDSLSRRGLAFIIEHGFWKTELGRSHYLMNLRQIVEAVHETVFFGVMMALLGADNYYEQWNRNHGTLHRSSLLSTLQDEKFLWAVVQKNIKGLFVMDAEIKDRMRRQGIEPTAWIFPPKMSIYASMIPEYFNEFQRRGETSKDALEKGPRMFDTFRGLPVYETRTFDVDFQGDGIEPLTNISTCGEYYIMDTKDMPHGIKVFSMASDKFELITMKDIDSNVINKPDHDGATMKFLWNGHDAQTLADVIAGSPVDLYRLVIENAGDAADDDRGQNFYDATGFAKSGPNPERDDAPTDPFINPAGTEWQVLASQPRHKQQAAVALAIANHCKSLSRSGYTFLKEYLEIDLSPCRYLLMRPWQAYRMSSAILARTGTELGQTFHGHHDFQLTDDVIHKVHVGHYTFYSKSIVRSNKHMYLARNVYCQGYEYGEDTTFVDKDCKNVPGTHSRSLPGSLVAVAIPLGEQVPNPLCADGNTFHAKMPHVDIRPDEAGEIPRLSRGVNPCQTLFDKYFDIADSSHSHSQDVRQVNRVCWRGASKHFNAHTGHHDIDVKSTGHWGPSVYDGCADVRKGMYAHLEGCN